MATLGEIEDALNACREVGNEQFILLQCASVYPAAPELINLRSIDTMRAAFGCPVGLSDHTQGISVAVGAAARGASAIEKHYTLSRQMKGPDHPFAIEPSELKAMVAGVREVEAALGDGIKRGPNQAEQMEMYRFARRSLVATVNVPKGTPLRREMMIAKRPGYGVKPKYVDLLVGRPAKVDIAADDVITWEMV